MGETKKTPQHVPRLNRIQTNQRRVVVFQVELQPRPLLQPPSSQSFRNGLIEIEQLWMRLLCLHAVHCIGQDPIHLLNELLKPHELLPHPRVLTRQNHVEIVGD
jgi:hypothetical protein